MSLFLTGMISGIFLGWFFSAIYFWSSHKNLLSSLPGVLFENKILCQCVLALFPSKGKGIFVYVKGDRYRVFKDKGDIKYIQVES